MIIRLLSRGFTIVTMNRVLHFYPRHVYQVSFNSTLLPAGLPLLKRFIQFLTPAEPISHQPLNAKCATIQTVKRTFKAHKNPVMHKMESNISADYKEFSALLRNPCKLPGLKELYHWQTGLHLWEYPSFESHTDWFILHDERPVSGKRALVRKITSWSEQTNKDTMDQVRFCITENTLDPEETETILSTLKDKSIIPFPSQTHIGLDGVMHGIQHDGIKLEWWMEGPKEWRSLITAVDGIRQWLFDNEKKA